MLKKLKDGAGLLRRRTLGPLLAGCLLIRPSELFSNVHTVNPLPTLLSFSGVRGESEKRDLNF